MFLLRIIVTMCFVQSLHGIRSRSKASSQILIQNTNRTLDCFFDLEGEELYSILWWKNDAIIGRFLAGGSRYNGTRVQNRKLKWTKETGHYIRILTNPKGSFIGTELLLRNIHKSFAGTYSCEVTAEAPYFHTANVTYDVQVITPPVKYPQLYGPKGPIPAGSIVSACCYSPPTTSKSEISFLINNKPVESVFMTMTEKLATQESRVILIRGVTFRAFRQLFTDGFLVLECSVVIGGFPWKTPSTLWPDDLASSSSMTAPSMIILGLIMLLMK